MNRLIYSLTILALICGSFGITTSALAKNTGSGQDTPWVYCPPNMTANTGHCRKCPPSQHKDITGTHCVID